MEMPYSSGNKIPISINRYLDFVNCNSLKSLVSANALSEYILSQIEVHNPPGTQANRSDVVTLNIDFSATYSKIREDKNVHFKRSTNSDLSTKCQRSSTIPRKVLHLL